MTGGRPVSQVGEFELIRSISNLIASSRVKSSGVLLEAGDDTATWHPRPGRAVALTTDVLVEGVPTGPIGRRRGRSGIGRWR